MLISPDEEIGSLGSGPVIAELGAAADIGLTYEPALADGSLAGARKGDAAEMAYLTWVFEDAAPAAPAKTEAPVATTSEAAPVEEPKADATEAVEETAPAAEAPAETEATAEESTEASAEEATADAAEESSADADADAGSEESKEEK